MTFVSGQEIVRETVKVLELKQEIKNMVGSAGADYSRMSTHDLMHHFWHLDHSTTEEREHAEKSWALYQTRAIDTYNLAMKLEQESKDVYTSRGLKAKIKAFKDGKSEIDDQYAKKLKVVNDKREEEIKALLEAKDEKKRNRWWKRLFGKRDGADRDSGSTSA